MKLFFLIQNQKRCISKHQLQQLENNNSNIQKKDIITIIIIINFYFK